MTFTNEERREVAARLRDMAPGSDWPKYVAEACGMDVSKMSNHFHTYTAQLCQHLADLIEPEPERTCRMTDNGCELCCSLCDTRHGYDDEPNYCMGCGAKVVDDARI